MSKEEYAKFLKGMEDRLGKLRSRISELEMLEKPLTGTINRSNPAVQRTTGKGPHDQLQGGGPLQAPTEFRKQYRNFTEELSRIKAQQDKK
jgi:hypothetical protein